MKTRILKMLLLCLLVSWCLLSAIAQPMVSCGNIVRHKFESKYVDTRNIDVWLPPNYNIAQRYPVVYMHDGQMLYDSTTTWNKQEWKVDELLCAMFNEGAPTCIVVGIWNNDKYRHAEYFPQKPLNALRPSLRDSIVSLNLRDKPLADNYLQFLTAELKPFIDKTYATQADKAHTFIAGSSMGGLISLYAICEYPEVFGAAACISTHWIGSTFFKESPLPIMDAFNTYLKKNLPSPKDHRLYFDYGTATLDSLYKPHQLRIDRTVKSKGYRSHNCMTRAFEGADHSERSWSARLVIPMRFLLQGR
ncbi:MAG: alpha/beta hydrolase [Saprospiraceae bacterium]|nr:alpha/beta hydrolase [Saprospiraceae bacterium]MBP7679437.1 alpha/beta hydrolase [Saprospiraceae bacterium]